MKTPICDFVKKYNEVYNVRLHMPGHKGIDRLGMESLDITEIVGADSLYEASGIILESEREASKLFGCDTYYSTEGSSHCIRAMMYLVSLYANENGEKPYILAARNCHKTFVSAAAMLDIDVEWIYSKDESYLSCRIDASELENSLCSGYRKPTAVYITSPDYLGFMADIESIARVCRRHGVLLCVDNAHGAYLKFLNPSLHPVDLGADICCDSAHKTLPTLTGGAYLHIGKDTPALFSENVKDALSLFGSTSPSYLILQSLDATNAYIADGYSERLFALTEKLSSIKEMLCGFGYSFCGDEPTKFTFDCKKYGYYGFEIADILQNKGIVCEFFDRDHLVLMFTPEISEGNLFKLAVVLKSIKKREAISQAAPKVSISERRMSIREAIMSPSELVPLCECEGRILARLCVSCPPAVPIGVCGEVITREMIEAFEYYGIDKVSVIKK